jgi:biotin-dependent carboxylase-like uncharacterized protein
MKGFKVIKEPFFSSVQDEGRFGYEQFGVPNSGVVDPLSYKLGNLLLDNDINAACIEIVQGNAEFLATNNFWITITGGDLNPKINGIPVKMWQTIYVVSNDILTFSNPEKGFRSYVCIKNGIKIPSVMSSKSTYYQLELGGKVLKKDDQIFIEEGPQEYKFNYLKNIPKNLGLENTKIKVIKSSEYNLFSKEVLDLFFNSVFTVTSRMNRVGLVLDGPKIKTIDTNNDIISSGTSKGVIQVPNDGMLYILINDCQTSGGYPRIFSVCTSDLIYLSQLKPEDKIQFELITIEESLERLRNQNKLINNNNIGLIHSNPSIELIHKNKNYNLTFGKINHKKQLSINGKPIKVEF